MTTPSTPALIVEPFAKDAVDPTYITNPIPLAPTDPGKANYSEGFPPANMTSPTLGGIPPSGADMNGILFAITSWLAFLQSGQGTQFDSDASDAFGPGYPFGSVLWVPAASPSDPGAFWLSTAADNEDDPGTPAGEGNWRNLTQPLYATPVAPTAGTHNDVDLFGGPSDYYVDVNTAAGNVTYTGFVAQFDGQTAYLTNTGANILTLAALSGSSGANNRFRLPTDLALVQNQTAVLKFSGVLGKWLLV